MTKAALAAILDRYLAGALPANVALMRLMMEARSEAEVDGALAEAARRDATAAEPLRAVLATSSGAFATVKAVMAEADHEGAAGSAAGPAHWRAVFDRLARVAPEAGVALYGLGSPDLLREATEEVVVLLGGWGLLGPDKAVLEIGCGIGRLSLAIAPHVRCVLGLDVSGAMIAEARRRGAGVANAAFAVTSGDDLRSVAEGSHDLVLAADVFPYLVAAGPALAERHVAEAARILRPGGALLILNYSYRGDEALDRTEAARTFAENGLALVRNGTRDLALWDALAFLGRKGP